MTNNIKLLDVVALTTDLPEENLWRGQVGTVVEILADGAAFEVEFSDREEGQPKAKSFLKIVSKTTYPTDDNNMNGLLYSDSDRVESLNNVDDFVSPEEQKQLLDPTQIPAKKQPGIDRSDPSNKLLEKTRQMFDDAANFFFFLLISLNFSSNKVHQIVF